MSKPHYRVDAYDRITARLKQRVEAERWLVTCAECCSKFDTRHFLQCPRCDSEKAREDRK